MNNKLVNLIINHLKENLNNKDLLIQELSSAFPQYIEEHFAYRSLINHNNPIQVGDSFSLSKEGIIQVLEGHRDRFQGEDIHIEIYTANIKGINLKKIILLLKEKELIDDYISSYQNEDEILVLEYNNLKNIYSGDYWTVLEQMNF